MDYERNSSTFLCAKKILFRKKVKKAEVRVCGLGQFNFYMNGKKVGDHELDPGWTNYHKYIEYVKFDVTDALLPGDNILGAEVGNGWFIKTDVHYTFTFPAFMPPNPNPYKSFGKSLVFAVRLDITYEDGSTEVIEADDTFTVNEHPVIMSNVYGSETIDGRLEQKGWSTCAFDDSSWKRAVVVSKADEPKGKLVEQFQPAIKIIADYDSKCVETVGNIRDIYDFGQNMSGILEFEVRGKSGDMVKFYPAEKLQKNGDVDQEAKNWVTPDMENWTIHDVSLTGQRIPWFNNPDAPKYPGIDWSKPTRLSKKCLHRQQREAVI